MTEEEILKLMDLMVGSITPTGSHGTDMDKIVPNIDLLGKVTVELVSQLNQIAEGFEDRQESSIKACGLKARHWIKFIKDEQLCCDDNYIKIEVKIKSDDAENISEMKEQLEKMASHYYAEPFTNKIVCVTVTKEQLLELLNSPNIEVHLQGKAYQM